MAKITFEELPNNAKEVLGQLFLSGPKWDGYVLSKTGRDILRENDLIERGNGWQWLTRAGVEVATENPSQFKEWFEGRWRRKANTLDG